MGAYRPVKQHVVILGSGVKGNLRPYVDLNELVRCNVYCRYRVKTATDVAIAGAPAIYTRIYITSPMFYRDFIYSYRPIGAAEVATSK